MPKRRGPNGEQLPPGISWDATKRRYRVHGRHGGRTLAEAKRKMRELDGKGKGAKTDTLEGYAARWLDRQLRKKRRNAKKDFGSLERHFLPAFGARHLTDIAPYEIVEHFWELYNREVVGAKTVKNIKGILSSVYSMAVFEQTVDANPCSMIPHDELPKAGRNPWPKFEPEEVAKLLTDERIRLDRRVLYGLFFWFADRQGEGQGLKFSDWDRTRTPLGAVTIDKQYDGRPLKSSRDDYTAKRVFPVHSEAAALLARWKLSGFASIYGRPPRDHDFIVPDPRTMGARTPNSVYKALCGEKGRGGDIRRVGIEKRPGLATHAFRKCWISMLDDAGVPRDKYRALTHTGIERDVLDHYVQKGWPALCDIVQRVELPDTAQLISIAGGKRHA